MAQALGNSAGCLVCSVQCGWPETISKAICGGIILSTHTEWGALHKVQGSMEVMPRLHVIRTGDPTHLQLVECSDITEACQIKEGYACLHYPPPPPLPF